MNAATKSNTPAIIAQARALADFIVPEGGSSGSPAVEMASKAAALMIDAALAADLNHARIEAGRKECEEKGTEFMYGGAPYMLLSYGDADRRAPERYTEQDSWRDYTGYLCHDERTAAWTAKWIAKYLDPRDADGNKRPGYVRQIAGKGWLAVTGSYKIGD